MNVQFIKKDDVVSIYTNVDELFRQCIEQGKSLESYLNKAVLFETNIPASEISLDMSEEDPVKTDFENVKRLYSALMGLSKSQASDERIWIAYAFGSCKDYMLYRWRPESGQDLKNRWLFGYSIRRALFRHGIARLWWIGHCTYDEKRTDPFELTAFVVSKQDIINQILDIGFNGNVTLVAAIVSALKDAEKKGHIIDREQIRKVSQYINAIGGMYIIDTLSYEEIYQRVSTLINNN